MVPALKRAGLALRDLYPMGVSLLWKAPLVLALVIVPEFAQHVAEIQLGMFASREAFAALASDPTRMAFGYVKIAGLVLAMLASARFWWTLRAGHSWFDLRGIAWQRLAIGALLFLIVPTLPELLGDHVSAPVRQALGVGLTIIFLPMLFLMLAGLFGDRVTPARQMWRRCWPWAVLMLALLVLGFGPPSWLHSLNHDWAIGAPAWLIWSLMIFDSLLVGLLAGLTGTALYLGYAAFARGQR